MPTPNYGFEKRQKELAKKRKKEDKLKAKADRKSGLLTDDGPATDGQDSGPEASANPSPSGTAQSEHPSA